MTTSKARPNAKSTTNRQGNWIDPSDGLLDHYFRDVAPIGVSSAEQEASRAERMDAAHRDAWACALREPALVPYLVDLCRRRVDPERWQLKKGRRGLDAVVSELRSHDMDYRLLRAVLEQLRRLIAGNAECELPASLLLEDGVDLSALAEDLQRAMHVALQARNTFINHNLRLVIKIAKRYRNGPMPLVDLIQEGNLGLIEAVKRFDHRRGFRFSTYATWWIRHAIYRAMAERGRTVRVPLHVAEAHRKVGRIRRDLGGQLGEPAPLEQVAGEAGIELDKLHELDMQLMPFDVRLDQESVDGLRQSELIADRDAAEPLEQVIHSDASAKALRLVEGLDPVEADILRRRFGLVDGESQTLRQIARDYSLSRERIRQLEHKGLGLLRKRLLRSPIRASSAEATHAVG